MSDLRRLTVSLAVGALVLLAAGCGGDPEPAEPSSPTSSTTSRPADASSGEPTDDPSTDGSTTATDHACGAIDVQAAGADNGVPLQAPDEGVGDVGGDEGCSLFEKGAPTVITVDLVTKHASLAKEGRGIQVSGQEDLEDVTVGGSPALLVRSSGSPVYVNLAMLAGDRLLTVRLLAPDAEPAKAEDYEQVVLAVAEQVAAAA